MEHQKRITLRMPEELYEEVKKSAEHDRRSLNAQIVYILEKYIREKDNAPNKLGNS